MASQGFFLILFLVILAFALWYYFSLKNRSDRTSMIDVDGGPRDIQKELKFWTEKVQDTSFQTPEVQNLAQSLKSEIHEARARKDVPKTSIDYHQVGKQKMTFENLKPIHLESANIMNAKSLNVHFAYNGHTWDAYEVLGVPAGASLRTVTKQYQETLIKADPQSRPFLDAAYQAILKKT